VTKLELKPRLRHLHHAPAAVILKPAATRSANAASTRVDDRIARRVQKRIAGVGIAVCDRGPVASDHATQIPRAIVLEFEAIRTRSLSSYYAACAVICVSCLPIVDARQEPHVADTVLRKVLIFEAEIGLSPHRFDTVAKVIAELEACLIEVPCADETP